MLIVQFVLILLDRLLYRRGWEFGKLVLHFIVVIMTHIWVFLVLPLVTDRWDFFLKSLFYSAQKPWPMSISLLAVLLFFCLGYCRFCMWLWRWIERLRQPFLCLIWCLPHFSWHALHLGVLFCTPITCNWCFHVFFVEKEFAHCVFSVGQNLLALDFLLNVLGLASELINIC